MNYVTLDKLFNLIPHASVLEKDYGIFIPGMLWGRNGIAAMQNTSCCLGTQWAQNKCWPMLLVSYYDDYWYVRTRFLQGLDEWW